MQHFCEAARIGIRACPHLDGEVCTNRHPCGSRIREDSKQYVADEYLKNREMLAARIKARNLAKGIDEDNMSDLDAREIMKRILED